MSDMYIAWIGFQRRQVSIAAYVNMTVRFFPIKRRVSKAKKLVAYIHASYKTFSSLLMEKPKVVWVQVPQTPALWVALFYRMVIRRDAKVVADCHNACFRKPWVNFPFGISSLRSADYVLVHNESLKSGALALGIASDKLVVLEDPPAVFCNTGRVDLNIDAPRPWGLFPAGFAEDEPIEELFEAAKLLPGVSFLVTGNSANLKNRDLLKNVPPNVIFLGFLSREDFDQLVMITDFVLALTKFDGIQLSVCGEAVGAGRPMVVSDTNILRTLYPMGTEHVLATGDAISVGVRRILGRLEQAEKQMLEFRAATQINWQKNRLQPFYAQLNPESPLIDRSEA